MFTTTPDEDESDLKSKYQDLMKRLENDANMWKKHKSQIDSAEKII